ncbi:Hypothetical protein EIN_037570, partial [Entamoeba invadens IP1]
MSTDNTSQSKSKSLKTFFKNFGSKASTPKKAFDIYYSPNDESENEYYIDDKLMTKAEQSIDTSFRYNKKYNLIEIDMLKQCNKEINRYINNNPEVNLINTKDLNATIYIN